MEGSCQVMHAYLVLVQGVEEDAHVVRPVEHCPAGHIRKSCAGEVCTAPSRQMAAAQGINVWALKVHGKSRLALSGALSAQRD